MSTKPHHSKNVGNSVKRKPNRKRLRNYAYTDEQMLAACRAVKEGGMAKTTAAKIFNVPKTTLLDRLEGRTLSSKLGKSPYLSPEEEKKLVQLVSLFYSKLIVAKHISHSLKMINIYDVSKHSGILESFILRNSQNFQISVLGMMKLWTDY